jgi:hypothetical protein
LPRASQSKQITDYSFDIVDLLTPINEILRPLYPRPVGIEAGGRRSTLRGGERWPRTTPRRRRRGRLPSWTCWSRFCCTSSPPSPTLSLRGDWRSAAEDNSQPASSGTSSARAGEARGSGRRPRQRCHSGEAAWRGSYNRKSSATDPRARSAFGRARHQVALGIFPGGPWARRPRAGSVSGGPACLDTCPINPNCRIKRVLSWLQNFPNLT